MPNGEYFSKLGILTNYLKQLSVAMFTFFVIPFHIDANVKTQFLCINSNITHHFWVLALAAKTYLTQLNTDI